MFMLNELWDSLIPHPIQKTAASSQIQINSTVIVKIRLSINCEWSGGVAEQCEKRSEKAPETGCVVNATLRCWQEGGIH